MPELPEVESLRRYLVAGRVPGRIITSAYADWPGVENTVDGAAGLSTLPGRRIMSARRHGKQLVLPMDRGVLGLHMGMTGRLVILGPDDEPLRYARYTFTLDDGRRIELDDVRRWAGAVLANSEDELTGRLGPDAIDPTFTSEMFVERTAGRRSAIKALLLDQSVLAGVGNIYADEALHRSGISPARRANRISRLRLARLHGDVLAVLNEAIDFIAANPDEHGAPYVVDAYDERMRLSRKRGAPCPALLQTNQLAQARRAVPHTTAPAANTEQLPRLMMNPPAPPL